MVFSIGELVFNFAKKTYMDIFATYTRVCFDFLNGKKQKIVHNF